MLNSRLGRFSAAGSRRRPFSRGYGAILPSSLAAPRPSVLGCSPRLPVSVCGTGGRRLARGFSWRRGRGGFPTSSSVPVTAQPRAGWFCLPRRPRALGRALPSARSPCPSASPRRSIAAAQRGNLNPLSIARTLRLGLRPRLTLGGQAFPRKPWAFDGGDSHPPLATHANILPSPGSTGPCGPGFGARGMPPYRPSGWDGPAASVTGFSPAHLRRAGTRPVGCYAVLG